MIADWHAVSDAALNIVCVAIDFVFDQLEGADTSLHLQGQHDVMLRVDPQLRWDVQLGSKVSTQ